MKIRKCIKAFKKFCVFPLKNSVKKVFKKIFKRVLSICTLLEKERMVDS